MFHNRRTASQSRRLLEAAIQDGTPRRFYESLWEGLRRRQISPGEISIKNMFIMAVENGAELVESFNPRNRNSSTGINLMEAGGAIDTTHFSNISGQIVYSEILDKFESPELIGNNLVTNRPTQFNGERVPGIGMLSDDVQVVGENEEYPRAGTPEEFVDTPETTKRGLIVELTKEAIFFDRTNDLVAQASAVGDVLSVNKEKRILDTIFGITTTYRRNGTAAQATYGDTHTNGDFDNLVASNALVDYNNVDTALQAFDLMTDPNTGEPIVISSIDMVVPRALLMTAARVLEATGIEQGAIDANTPRTMGPNPLNSQTVTRRHSFNIWESPYVKNRTGSNSTWFLGDFKKAFRYMENWPITVVQAPANSEAEFNRDVVSAYKASERGTGAVYEPRFVIKCTA